MRMEEVSARRVLQERALDERASADDTPCSRRGYAARLGADYEAVPITVVRAFVLNG
jgi:hypothetical protein